MPINDPSGRDEQPTSPSEEELFVKQFEEVWRKLEGEGDAEKLRGNTKQIIRTLMECETSIVRDPEAAPRFAERHASHVRSRIIADAMYAAHYGNDDEKKLAVECLNNERSRADKNGVFVMDYSARYILERLSARYPDGRYEYIVAEASGSHPDVGHPRHGKPAPCADAHIHVPEARDDAMPVFSIPNERDVPHDKVRVSKMADRQHAVAQIEDLTSDVGMGGIRAASFALDAALRMLKESNRDRGQFAIQTVTAEIIMITGIRLRDCTELHFGKDIPGTPIDNQRSRNVFRKFESDVVHHFRDIVTLLNRTIPVHGHPHVESLIADWNVIAADIKNP
jgi:hypothetical protein